MFLTSRVTIIKAYINVSVCVRKCIKSIVIYNLHGKFKRLPPL